MSISKEAVKANTRGESKPDVASHQACPLNALGRYAPRPSARRGRCLVFGETEKTFELGHWQRVLFLRRLYNKLGIPADVILTLAG